MALALLTHVPPTYAPWYGDAHQVEFNLDDLDSPPGPAPPDDAAAAAANHWGFADRSSDDDMYYPPIEPVARFVKRYTVDGDVHAFSKAMLRHIQSGRMSVGSTV